jgi:hypothetical protein
MFMAVKLSGQTVASLIVRPANVVYATNEEDGAYDIHLVGGQIVRLQGSLTGLRAAMPNLIAFSGKSSEVVVNPDFIKEFEGTGNGGESWMRLSASSGSFIVQETVPEIAGKLAAAELMLSIP